MRNTQGRHCSPQACARCGGPKGDPFASLCVKCAAEERRKGERGDAEWWMMVVFGVFCIGALISRPLLTGGSADAQTVSTADAILAEVKSAHEWARRAAGVPPDWIAGPVPDGWNPGLWCRAPDLDGTRLCAHADLSEHGVAGPVPPGWYCDDGERGTLCGPVPDGWRCGPVPDGWRCAGQP